MPNTQLPHIKLKPYYKTTKQVTKKHWDVIVIGSGIAGMSCAASLAKQGKKVLIVEQHYLPGGFTHCFSRKGYTWDVGVHAISEVKQRDVPGRLLNWLTDNGIKWNSLGDPYDRFYYPDGFKIGFPDSKKKFIDELKNKFPDEHQVIDQYVKLISKAVNECKPFFIFKTLSKSLDQKLSKLYYKLKTNWWAKSTQDVLDSLTDNKKLKAVLVAQWGYHGSIPKESSFGIHALVVRSFWYGAYYPVGGSDEFAINLLKPVLKSGGQTIVRAPVKELLIKDQQCIGIQLESGEQYFAKHIISAAGAKNSINGILPASYQQSSWAKEINTIPSSPSYICLNLGFKGDIKKAGASSQNCWFNETYDMNQQHWDLTKDNSEAPIIYVSFPSLKDPNYDPGTEQKHTGECVTFVDWESFEKWKATKRGKRTADYQEFKKDIQNRIQTQLFKHMPELKKYLDYAELSTPLSAQFFTRANKGSIYGLESSPKRYTCSALRTKTPIKNFYLTGIDIATLGVMGGLISGLLTAATIDKRLYRRLL
ncbi:hypothetical protein BVY03_00740 [bacterium K02(2017)]|nr:hypothetical protein BVY03_00740 [bacterium K02(2017)]